MSDSTFRAVGETENTLFGPRGMVVCGHTAEEHGTLREILAELEMQDIKPVIAGEEDADTLLHELFSTQVRDEAEDRPPLSRAVVLAGISERELHDFMAAYRGRKLPRPLWACLTPVSQDWPLKDLLAELSAERKAMGR